MSDSDSCYGSLTNKTPRFSSVSKVFIALTRSVVLTQAHGPVSGLTSRIRRQLAELKIRLATP